MSKELEAVGFFDPISWPKGGSNHERCHWLGRIVEPYFQLWQKDYQVIDTDSNDASRIIVSKNEAKLNWKQIAGKVVTCTLKIFSYIFFAMPMLFMKLIYRAENNFCAVKGADNQPGSSVAPGGVNTPPELEPNPPILPSELDLCNEALDKISTLKFDKSGDLDSLCQFISRLKSIRIRASRAQKDAVDKIDGRLKETVEKRKKEIITFFKNFEQTLKGSWKSDQDKAGSYLRFVSKLKDLGIDPVSDKDLYNEISKVIKPIGNKNFSGANCYMNAVLQAMMNTTDLVRIIKEGSFDKDFIDLQNCFKAFVKAYEARDQKEMETATRALRDELFKRGHINGSKDSQQDAEEAVFRPLLSAANYGPQERTTMTFNLNGVEIKKVVPETPVLPMIPLQIGGGRDLQELINTTFSPENVNDPANAYRYTSDDGVEHLIPEFNKQTQLIGNPDYMFIHLKRFSAEWDRESKSVKVQKIEDPLVLPAGGVVDLSIAYGAAGKGDNKYLYEVDSVVVHYGGTGGGHYVANVKRGDEWYECDDSRVSKIDDASKVAENGYILVLKRVVPK